MSLSFAALTAAGTNSNGTDADGITPKSGSSYYLALGLLAGFAPQGHTPVYNQAANAGVSAQECLSQQVNGPVDD